jgi:multidrug efflux system membrane fusion protein
MSARRRAAAGLAVAAVAVGSVGVWRATATPAGEGVSTTTTAPPATATVSRRDLVDSEAVSGTLGYGDTSPLTGQLQGIVTGLPAVGTVVAPGQMLYEVDGRPVLLLPGTRPMYRRHEPAMTAGEDVRQLEQALIDVGHAKGTGLTRANTEWSDATTAAVKRWEKATGRTEDGTVEPGEVVFQPAAVRVASRSATVGSPAQPGAAVLQVTATTRSITVELSALKAVKVKAGDAVGITLPDRASVDGVVASIGTTASADDDGAPDGQGDGSTESKVKLTVTVADQAKLGTFEEAPVDVRLTKETAKGVLAVPVAALLALAEGGYAVEVVDPSSTTRLVAVETGLFAGTFVEVRSPDLQAGAKVVVPA